MRIGERVNVKSLKKIIVRISCHHKQTNINPFSISVRSETNMKLIVKGTDIEMNDFVSKVMEDVLLALLSNLRDVDIGVIDKIEIS